jgi:RimJ/RimL family protein N-acetyltransferase
MELIFMELLPFTEDLLPVVQPWFRHPGVVQWLGGPTWVALVSGEVYDRWCRCAETPDGPAMGLAYVVDPWRWRQGFGTAALLAVLRAPAVADVVVFAAGIEPANIASARCAVAAGFAPDSGSPDEEGMIYYALRRTP